MAVIDSGWHSEEPDERVLPGIAIADRPDGSLRYDSSVADEIGHGTLCAQRIRLICPHAHILPVKIFHRDLGASGAALIAALDWVLRRTVHVVSLSLVCDDLVVIGRLRGLCDSLHAQGTHVVAAADNATGRGFPAEFAGVLGVRAARRSRVADVGFSRGEPIECVADGSHRDARYRGVQFNSIATATVAGLVAGLEWSRGRLSPDSLRTELTRICTPLEALSNGSTP